MIDVSIIIVSFNTKNLLKQCIDSIYQHTVDVKFEIIVVDNSSTDDSVRMIRDLFKNVILIESTNNLGFGKANNLGVSKAQGEFLFLLNSDTILIENSIEKLLYFYKTKQVPNLAVLGARLLDANKNTHISYGNFPSLSQELFEFGLSKMMKSYYHKNLSPSVIDISKIGKEVDYVMGADMFIEKSIFNSLGGFDEDFFLYYEETELCFRLKKLGYKIYWYPNTSIVHYLGASSSHVDGINYWVIEQLQRSKYLYFKKCHGKFLALLVISISFIKLILTQKKINYRKLVSILFKLFR